jgi:biotin carboxyl carrier protein
MTFEVELGNRVRTVSVSHADRQDRYSVVIEGRAFEVLVRRLGDNGLAVATVDSDQQPNARAADKTHGGNDFWSSRASRQVFVTNAGTSGEVLVTFDGRAAVATLNGRRGRPAADTVAHADGEQSVKAPMPGRVVRVLVAAGDEVSVGQGIVIVEAMKMENELRAPKTGRVKNVSVSAGTSVDAGKVLVVIE